MHLPHARRQDPLSMRQPKFKSWPAWHKRLQLAIHLEYARAPFFFSGDQAAQELAGREQSQQRSTKLLLPRTATGMAPKTKSIDQANLLGRTDVNKIGSCKWRSAAPHRTRTPN